MTVTRCLFLAGWMLASPALAAERVMLILGGGKDAAAAQTWLTRWQQELAQPAGDVVLAKGFPKSFKSADVTGLNPGFHIVVLGVCAPDEGVEERRFLKALFPFSYEKKVETDEVGCPKWVGMDAKTVFKGSQETRAGNVVLQALTVVSPTPPKDESSRTQFVRLVARAKDGKLLGTYVLADDAWTFRDDDAAGCTTQTALKGGAVIFDRTCVDFPQAYCNRQPGKLVRVRLSWSGTKWEEQSTVVKKWDVDYDKDCAE